MTPESRLRSRVIWSMAAMDSSALLELVALAERLAPANAMATTYTAPAPPTGINPRLDSGDLGAIRGHGELVGK